MLSSRVARHPTLLPSTSSTNCSRKCLNDQLYPSRWDTPQPLIPFCTGDVCLALAPPPFYLQVNVAPMLWCCCCCCHHHLGPTHGKGMTLLRTAAIHPPLNTCHRAEFLCRSYSCCIPLPRQGRKPKPVLLYLPLCLYIGQAFACHFFVIACLTFI
jgi:hypothetical protein